MILYDYKCPYCGELFIKEDLLYTRVYDEYADCIPEHTYPPYTKQICPGSNKKARAINDPRPPWKDIRQGDKDNAIKEQGITDKAWEVYRHYFTDGEDVVVEDDSGRFYYGKLSASTDDGVLITGVKKSKFIEWDRIELIAHDGFPVKPIMGMSQEEAIKRGNMTPNEVIRLVLLNESDRLEKEKETTPGNTETEDIDPSTVPHRHDTVRGGRGYTLGGGCPFVMEDVSLAEIHNRGNDKQYGDDCEVLVFQSKDGAVLHSYDTDHLFLNP